jgi:hypothetical protein
MDVHTHLGIHDHAAALENLPPLPTLGGGPEAPKMAATGTDGLPPKSLRLRTASMEGDKQAKTAVTGETIPLSRLSGNAASKTAKKTGFANDCDLPIMNETTAGPRGGMADTGDLKSPRE